MNQSFDFRDFINRSARHVRIGGTPLDDVRDLIRAIRARPATHAVVAAVAFVAGLAAAIVPAFIWSLFL